METRNPHLPLQGKTGGLEKEICPSLNAQKKPTETILEQDNSLQSKSNSSASSAVCKDSSSHLDSDDLSSQSNLNELVHSPKSPLVWIES